MADKEQNIVDQSVDQSAVDDDTIYGVPDEESPEWTDEDFAQARPFPEVFPELYAKWMQSKLMQGRAGQEPAPRRLISLRIDSEALGRLRASGPGWRRRLNDIIVAESKKTLGDQG
jgi:uncharacterized protein (DUF4415 family)